ncbi:MAG: sulfonate transport system ATP-binding protein [Actinomycetota bacterium]|nr:sulfonate transport system ATP-binding protein [Actinomycetota bacterium]
MTKTALTLRGVSRSFGGGADPVVAMSDVDLTLAAGEFLTVVGASGCGKSTMHGIAAGLEEPTTGAVELNGTVALMFQDATLLPWLTARGNIELALRLRGVRDRGAEVDRLLAVVRLQDWGDKRPHELSGGMRQRVALARCLAQGADIVLMDEPLGALDAMTRDHLHDEIERVVGSEGLSVIFVTHNVREAVRLGDRVVLMANNPGRIVYELDVDLPRPRRMDSAEVATRAADLMDHLRGTATEPTASRQHLPERVSP